jgi:excisionase family DNA binding protein
VTVEGQAGAGAARSSTRAALRCPVCGEHLPQAALLTLEEVADRLGTSLRHVRRLADERRIPIVKVGRYVRFDGHDLEHWIDDHRIGVVDPAALARGARRGTPHPTTSERDQRRRQRTA